MLTDVLDAPVAELAVGDDVDARQHLVDAWAFVFFETILEDVLDHKTASLAESHLMPHAAKCFVDVRHNLGRRVAQTKLEQLLPHVAGVSVDDCLGTATEEFVHHECLVLLRHIVVGLLDNVAAERIHAQVESVAADGLSDGNHLFRHTVLKASLNQKVAKAIDHERTCLVNDGLYDVVLLFRCANLEFLLEKNRSLLIIAINDPVDDTFPVAIHLTRQKATIVDGLVGTDVGHLHGLCAGWLPIAEFGGCRRQAGADGCRAVADLTTNDIVLRQIVERGHWRCDAREASSLTAEARSRALVWHGRFAGGRKEVSRPALMYKKRHSKLTAHGGRGFDWA